MASETKNKVYHFFEALGFNLSKEYKSSFIYHVNFAQERKENPISIPVAYYYLSSQSFFSDHTLFDIHQKLWNSNYVNNFIVFSDQETLIFNAKIKPNKDNPKFAVIYTIPEGVDSKEIADLKQIVSRQRLDAGYFFDFVIEKQKQKREHEVDKDLLLNLIALREDLLKHSNQPRVVDLLILRCLFLKYLEDRGIYDSNYLVTILESGKADKLINAFEEVRKINGDIFKDDILTSNQIKEDYLGKLALFFSTDYQSGQLRLFFPYRFDYIPIQLISNVYEAFLDNAKKQGKGIYYTPKFVVDFMLGRAFLPVLKKNKNLTILDPACGSGAFLVEAFKQIVKQQRAENNFEKKKQILENQIFGIDNDPQALQIAAFSLYLTLLEDLDPNFIKYQIENQAPILPSLINKSLLCANTLTRNEVFEAKVFDCIVGNPPWGSVPQDDDEEHLKERKAIGAKGKKGTESDYESVSDYQRSQAFVLRVQKWAHSKTSFALIVNNAIFLNENAKAFRETILKKYHIKEFYELSNLNKILFRKRTIGKVNGKTIEIGATEPCAVLVFNAAIEGDYAIKYISPKLNRFSEAFHLIHYTDYDQKTVRCSDFLQDDLIWRIFVNGGWEDYQLVRKLYLERNRDFIIECRSGFQAKKGMIGTGMPILRKWIKAQHINKYSVSDETLSINWNQNFHRKRVDESIYEGERILIPVRPHKEDQLRLRGARVVNSEVFSDDVLGIRVISSQTNYISSKTLSGIINSFIISYYCFHTSVQWGKGDFKRPKLRTEDIESIPLPNLTNGKLLTNINELVSKLELNLEDINSEQQLQEYFYELYGLLEFEKEVIKEFYNVNVYRKNSKVNFKDLQAYANKFREVYELVLDESYTLETSYKISPNLGSFLCFSIAEKQYANLELQTSNLQDDDLFHLIKSNQLEEAFYSNRLNEIKTKLYESNRFFIIKSNFFKDWTVRQAINDANEEIKLLTHVPALNE
ncbi:MAG: class I SAM-dependent DNA methyltransferase [Saprospiraceae bacterium]